MTGDSLTLNRVRPLSEVCVAAIGDVAARESLRAMGVIPGSRLRCLKRLGRGPLVVRANGVTLALGPELASTITVAPLGENGEGEDL